ncbi:hypothetical protein DFA_04110 [Cavenderia fasciculata]|uniref:Uncharacterized protein n=1 Tax=Cavenderia fasciculata TaxID=261658 RepID=F4Q1B4_CACFS|nr:uncharacterized protein DFA_04110 [Cavenderia fasciculata]EGG18615.1 hypothetical protein DFA_04110 [Cavenderia fasciculata]|eukprot:XP_004366519.1 hypothetical protein DFA_04110 [Cavenderia fasciculata]
MNLSRTATKLQGLSIRYYSSSSKPVYMSYNPVHRSPVLEKGKSTTTTTTTKKSSVGPNPVSSSSNSQQVKTFGAPKTDQSLPTHQVRSASSTYLVVDDA